MEILAEESAANISIANRRCARGDRPEVRKARDGIIYTLAGNRSTQVVGAFTLREVVV